ncbi:hypothetical protein ACIBF7_41605 [Nonomuraea sp. NPDC050478]
MADSRDLIPGAAHRLNGPMVAVQAPPQLDPTIWPYRPHMATRCG